jgi:hypothetical protein
MCAANRSRVRGALWARQDALFFTRASFNGPGYPATNRETGGSNPPARTIFGSSSKGQGAALRRLKFRFDRGRADQRFPERRPTGEVPGCLPGLDEFDSR